MMLLEARAGKYLYGSFHYPDAEDKLAKPEIAEQIKYIAKGLKKSDEYSLGFASSVMANTIKQISTNLKDIILVPIPSSSGSTEANLKLCEAIAAHIDVKIADILTAPKAESSYLLRKAKQAGKTAQEISMSVLDTSPIEGVILIDNVITTGNTIYAAQRTLKDVCSKPIAVAFAIAKDPTEMAKSEFHQRVLDLAGV